MAVEVGQIFTGVVNGITKFGAFITLSDGSTGLCHISEITDKYVKEVSEHLEEKQEVKVKVISVEKGKVSLSIKQATMKPRREPARRGKGFEDLLGDFIKNSDEKLKDVKSAKTRRGNGYNSKK